MVTVVMGGLWVAMVEVMVVMLATLLMEVVCVLAVTVTLTVVVDPTSLYIFDSVWEDA